MRTKTMSKTMFVIFTLALLIIIGWGCKSSIPPEATDTGSEATDTTADWQTYRNEEWGVSMIHPTNWHVREDVQEAEGARELTVFFNDNPIPDPLPPQPVFLVTLSVIPDTLSNVVEAYQPLVEQSTREITGRTATRIVYFSDLLNMNDVVYLFEDESRIVELRTDVSNESSGVFQQMLVSLQF